MTIHARPNPKSRIDPESPSETLRQQAERCRRLAKATYDRHTSHTLNQMAESYDATADSLSGTKRR